jgi:flagellar biogenesis protein FliO
MNVMQILMPTAILIGIIVAMWLTARYARNKLGIGAGTVMPGSLKVVGRKQLEPRKSLYVVQIADRYILVGTGEHSVNLIDRITPEEYELMSDEPVAAAPREVMVDSPVTHDELVAHLAQEQRFATVGESFKLLLNKAKTSRSSK